MLRRRIIDTGAATSGAAHPRPPIPPRPAGGEPGRSAPLARRHADRLRAAAIHLAASAAAAGAVLALVFLAWYPSPLASLLGVDAILLIVLGVDVVLGPLFTLIVFDRRKKRLAWDLGTIAALQLAALAFGVWTIHQGRPAFVVLAKDRFEVVAPSELAREAREAARDNPHARADLLAPRWVAARLPDSLAERARITLEAATIGRDVQHHPHLYVDIADEAGAALARALPLSRLRELNPGRGAEVDAAVAATGRSADALRYLPLRAPVSDGAVLLGHPDGRVLGVVRLVPW
jgi:hypothetical protein